MADSSSRSAAPTAGPQSSKAPVQSTGAGESSRLNASDAASPSAALLDASKPKKKRHRAGRKRKTRRQSFLALSEATEDNGDETGQRPGLLQASRANASQQESFYRLQSNTARSNTSLESEALLDHREHGPLKSRRDTLKSSLARVAMPFQRRRPSDSAAQNANATPRSRPHYGPEVNFNDEEEDNYDGANDRTPLLGARNRSKPHLSRTNSAHGNHGSHSAANRSIRRTSTASKTSSRRRMDVSITTRNHAEEPHDVNNPPSVPGSPTLGSPNDIFLPHAQADKAHERDAIIDISGADGESRYSSSPEGRRRRSTIADLAERDVCFPYDDEDGTDHAVEDDYQDTQRDSSKRRRRRDRIWPDFEILEDWSREEKEERTQQDMLRAKKISEPVMVGGRLRPSKTPWHREEDESPFRYTYFNETLDGTIHARTISDLQDDMTFQELFLPDPIELSDDSESEDEVEDDKASQRPPLRGPRTSNDGSVKPAGDNHAKQPSVSRETSQARPDSIVSKTAVDSAPPSGNATPKQPKKRYGQRPTFWLDVFKPTETEMKVLAKAFGIHQLTSEDILMDEPREKVELFPSYYFVNYRTFEQDKDSVEYMEGINMYIIVFRTGIITFHHSMSPHPANVRRRIRQLNDYMSPTADWISYAIIDDVTDVYAPLVSGIEEQVDAIDEEILHMHRESADKANNPNQKQQTDQKPKDLKATKGKQDGDRKHHALGDLGAVKSNSEKPPGEKSGGDTLRRVGECRKQVMSLYRLLGNKADVIKGFAKRCNEHWEVAPRSEIGLYLGDIQDHIVTMTGNLSHFEGLLSRAHGNYMAQINIRMNERAELNADVLGKLTVLGTIVLPMNIITGMWGMNVWVPGQEYEGDLTWFFGITAGLIAFGVVCYITAKKVYGIV